jgi:hypothetical protein
MDGWRMEILLKDDNPISTDGHGEKAADRMWHGGGEKIAEAKLKVGLVVYHCVVAAAVNATRGHRSRLSVGQTLTPGARERVTLKRRAPIKNKADNG